MRIAILSHTYLDYENRKNIHALSEYFDVRVVLPNSGPILIHSDYEFRLNEGEEGHYLAFDKVKVTSSQFFLRTFTLGLRKSPPDIIVVEYPPWSIIFLQMVFARLLFFRKTRIVSFIKKNTYRNKPGMRGVAKNMIASFSLRRCDHIIVASDMAKTMLANTFPISDNKIDIDTHVGVDVNHFAPRSHEVKRGQREQSPVIIGYCGRFEDIKGLPDLLEAVKIIRLQRTDTNIQLRLLGGGGYTSNMDKELSEMAAREAWLQITPPVEHSKVAEFLKELDIFVLPARVGEDHQEHDAQALLEAMASGAACIGTTSGIIPEILGDGTGLIVEHGMPEALAKAILELVDDQQKRMKYAKKAREKAVKIYSVEAVTLRKSRIYKGLFNGQ